MWFPVRRAHAGAAAALAAALCLWPAGATAKAKKPYWMVSFVGGVMVPVRDTADERELGLGVGMRVGYTTKIGLGLALVASYSPLPVADPPPAQNQGDPAADVVSENHFASAALVPRFTIGREVFRLTLGAGGGGIMEQTRLRPAGEEGGATRSDTVFAPAALGEIGIETHFWGSGGVVISGSYLRSFGDREAEVGALLGGLIFTFR
jgi:hypothetical protein